ncbi:cation:proton antiporter [Helcococcus sueciensis]|uniref:cation:proton antiporter n=1 Tax=Helcococcus sueciensis TaxID=241555 RepID=UPI0004164478|nr:cation:proton antiporter [Helcococcus sueciensis]
MLGSLSLIILVGLFMSFIMNKLHLPRIIGMLIAGIVLGPFVLNLIDTSILQISAELRKIALIIILIKAGITLDLKDLKKVGRPALLMSFLPATFEIIAYSIFAPMILGISRVDAILMGTVLGAVSPAVVVPRTVSLIERKIGTKEGVPQLILAGATLDDIFVIVLFTTFLNLAVSGNANYMSFVNIPISIILGVILGVVVGYILVNIFDIFYKHERYIRNSLKLMIIIGVAFGLVEFETVMKEIVSISGLLAVFSMSLVIKIKSSKEISDRIAEKTGKLWIVSEVFLFVLLGAAVDIRYTMEAGLPAIVLIFVTLIIRAIGVISCMIGTNLSFKERLFCVISYLPKATVQAAIGSIPLAMGIGSGNIILSVAVLGILITAPLGAIGMDIGSDKLLKKEYVD